MLKATPFIRKKMEKEVEILDDEMSSRYEKIHSTDGLCHTLVELFNAMAELRMMAEYGDYLVYTCSALKTESMNDMIWKVEKLDWQAVAERIKKEETTLTEERQRRLLISPTPYLNDVTKAADRLGHDFELVRYQILAYADRNNFYHSGLKAMINHGDFQILAERIMEDKNSLKAIFRGRPSEQIEMRTIIKIVENEWFDKVYVDESRKERPVKFLPSEKALSKMRSMAPSRPNSPIRFRR